ncbi:MAG: DUF92 domain-containing protein [Anaerolineae bacterium]
MSALNLLLGFLLSAFIAYLGYRGRSLSPSGVVGAIVVGTLIFGLGGWVWGLLLIVFFISSSLLSRYREGEKQGLAEKFAKVGGRDLGQALANGGWGALLAIAHALRPHPLLFAAFVGAMAAVNADTWATELGVLSPSLPRLITTGQPVPVGTSGGVSPLGTMASLAGALLIGLLALILEALAPGGDPSPLARWLPLAAGLGGLAGSLFDSLLGATVQSIYYCEACQKETESQVHHCGATTQQTRGWRWLDNDGVNFLSSVVGSTVAGLMGGLAF